jgi:hypothetical protein
MLFLLTSAAGSALWAAELEGNLRRAAASQERQQGHAGDQYADDPV